MSSYDYVSRAFNKLVMYQGSQDIEDLRSAYGLIGNAIQLAKEEEE